MHVDNENALQFLTDLEEIKRLKAKYCWAVDNKQWAIWSSVFTEDVEADFTDDFSRLAGRPVHGVLKGREHLVKTISAAMPEGLISVHQAHMPQIDITAGDTATGIWHMHDFIDYGERHQNGYGFYHDVYERQNGKWLIKRYRLQRHFAEWLPKDLGPPPALVNAFR
jgi:hypothetical protein